MESVTSTVPTTPTRTTQPIKPQAPKKHSSQSRYQGIAPKRIPIRFKTHKRGSGGNSPTKGGSGGTAPNWDDEDPDTFGEYLNFDVRNDIHQPYITKYDIAVPEDAERYCNAYILTHDGRFVPSSTNIIHVEEDSFVIPWDATLVENSIEEVFHEYASDTNVFIELTDSIYYNCNTGYVHVASDGTETSITLTEAHNARYRILQKLKLRVGVGGTAP